MADEKKTVVVGVTGSIAAYKAADLVSKLSQNSLDVHVIMTDSATKLVSERTFQTLSRNPVVTTLWDLPEWKPGHISLADKALILVIAPCTANMIAKMANGIADDALSTYYLSHRGQTMIAPAMNNAMWAHPATLENCERLKKRGCIFVGPAKGMLACGTEGDGRMEEPALICRKILEIADK